MAEELHRLLKDHRAGLIASWMRKTERAISPGLVAQTELLDQMPEFIDAILAALAPGAAPPPPSSEIAREHGAQRLRLGFDIAAVVSEYGLLEECILETAEEANLTVDVGDQMVVARCVNKGIGNAARQYVSQRDLERDREASAHLGFIAHEVRNPLSAAQLAFAQLRRAGLAPSGRATEVVERSLRRTADVIENALAQTSLKLGIEPKLQRIHPPSFLREIVDDLALEAEARELTISITDAAAIDVQADPRLLRSALFNLVSNAIKFSREGTRVALSVFRGDGQVTIEVADACGGLPPGKAEDLFAPLVQRGEDRTGYGLGLAIARQAVEAHAGTIALRDLPGHGCVFSVVLPASGASRPGASRDAAPSSAGPS